MGSIFFRLSGSAVGNMGVFYHWGNRGLDFYYSTLLYCAVLYYYVVLLTPVSMRTARVIVVVVCMYVYVCVCDHS